ncbi:23S rRNA (cytosine1962-C5)-methyltransferase [Microbulbifer donghaiensis]|uniref:23S rRNA (Cytosine1962-C5)-methyltransferase n=1 Tax=Microbulbifer donghaiensis TaxID=494016 RepID=A0A1M5APY9_9GAMM|nr:class I SAM-dependent rRNA methyltransferase [Microbulbifer donghaiensis]SHF32299.1 23S rRNA (cytosine1962-C5)-methyltransferase [Microbulbifer donghaiensis]
MPELILNRGAERRLKRGHLWIYSNEVDTKRSPLKGIEPGCQCPVLDSQGKPLGTAFVNPGQLICGRLVSRSGALDGALLRERLAAALAMRQRYFEHPSYRLVYGDSDRLPGLVVDRFGDYLVVQISNWGMEKLLPQVVETLSELVQPKGILLRNDHQGRAVEEMPLVNEVVFGEVPEMAPFEENGVPLLAPVHAGQKTGWFYDHRDNRARLNQWVRGKRVLDLFSYAGGWGVQTLARGALSATCVDASEQALDWCRANAEHNGLGDKLQTVRGKAVEVLKAMVADGEKFDVVVLDPPAFIKRRKDHKAGLAAYRHINELAMRLLAADGLLVSASCSMHLAADELLDCVRGAAHKLQRPAALLGSGGQGADHPVHPSIPETRYLKAHFVHLAAAAP